MVDFGTETFGNRSFLVYECGAKDKINHVEKEMLRQNHIMGLLPYSIEQTNDKVKLSYEVTSKVKIDSMLRNNMNKEQLYKILNQILVILENATDYLLEPDHFILETKNIYIEPGEGKIYLVYLPVENETNEVFSLDEFLKKLLSNITYDTAEDSTFYVNLINFVNKNKNISPRQFREALSVFGGKSVAESGGIEKNTEKEVKAGATKTPGMPGNVSVKSGENLRENGDAGPAQPLEMNNQVSSREMKSDTIPSGNHPKKEKRFSLFGSKKQKQPKKPRENGIEIPGQAPPQMEIPGQEPPQMEISGQKTQQEVSPEKILEREEARSTLMENIENLMQMENEADVSVYDETNGTVIMDEDYVREAYLENSKTGETILIAKERFLIGRNSEFVDHTIRNNPTVGRVHMEVINLKNGQYAICDQNSKNGTYCNGVRLTGDQIMNIKDGDKIRLGSEEFIFHN